MKHLNVRRCKPVGTLNLAQILRFGLLAFAYDQQSLIRLPHGSAPLQVAGGLPMFGLVVLPHRVNAPRPWLALASRRESEFRFVQAIVPLALFGFLHGIHEWVEMYQKIAVLSSGYIPTTLHEVLRLLLLVATLITDTRVELVGVAPGNVPLSAT